MHATIKKILIIEDNHDMRENIVEMLELANYAVINAKNGKSGIELVKVEKPNLIICDIMMTGLDGYGVLKELRKIPETSSIPFIFLTARIDKINTKKGKDLGASEHYLIKPFDRTELLDAVRLHL